MCTQRLAGMIGLVAVVTLGVIGIDRWTKDAKAQRSQAASSKFASRDQEPAPGRASTIHYQVDPSEPPLPPPAPTPKETTPPPLISTGELEKQLKESLDNLQKVLPKLPGAEESTLPPEAAKASEPDKKLPLPPPPVVSDKKLSKDESIPPPPPSSNVIVPAIPVPNVSVPASDSSSLSIPGVVAPVGPGAAKPSAPPVSSGVIPPPSQFSDAPKPLNPSVTVTPTPITQVGAESTTIRNVTANVSSQDDFQKRLTDLEMKYLKDTVAELDRRIQQMPSGDGERRKLEQDQQRLSDRLNRLMKVAEWAIERRVESVSGKSGPVDSPWTMNLETVDGKTVLQATVHRKARFKITCERLDLQTPRGTLLAVGQVQLSGEGFQGTCERLSIPLNDDRFILEGNAQVGIRTQAMALIQERKEGLPPVVEPSRQDEPASSAVPILHLKGDHLDVRWSDLLPGAAAGSARADDPLAPMIRATPGPLVKVAYNSPANEKWSAWGILRRTNLEKDGRPTFVIEDRDGNPVVYVNTPAGMSLADYVGKRVSVFGRPTREEGRTTLTFTASHVAWE